MADYRPPLLISYAYIHSLDKFEATCHQWNYREVIIDSGAWTAHTVGRVINVHEYIDACKRIRAADPKRIAGFFSLDVIGDWRASLNNTETMAKAGVDAIPVFHYGEPWDVLKGLAKDYPKIGIGGIAKDSVAKKMTFAEQCFQRVWPARIHGLGYGSEKFIEKFPFHSCDASSWKAPARFGMWASMGRSHLSVRISPNNPKVNLKSEALSFMAIEHRARGRWGRVMQAQLKCRPDEAPTIYLATDFCATDKRFLAI